MPKPSASCSSGVVSSAVTSTRIGFASACCARNDSDSAGAPRRAARVSARLRPDCLASASSPTVARRQAAGLEHEAAACRSPPPAAACGVLPFLRLVMMPASARPICPNPSNTTSRCAARVADAAADLRQLERVVDRALRRRRVLARDHERDVQLRRSLRDRDDVDPRLRQRAEHARRDARGGPPSRGRRPRPSPAPPGPRCRRSPCARSRRGTRPPGGRAPARADASGTEKQIDCSDDDCEISDTLIPSWCSASNVRAAMPGTPSMPLPATVISACPAAADSALTGYLSSVRRAEISVPAAVGVGERAHEHRDRAPRHRDQRARVQHLGAVVRELRRLAQVQLRDDAGVGHDARVGGEQARDVLPQRHLARRQRAPEQRRRQVGAAASQRRHRALLSGRVTVRHLDCPHWRRR